MNTVTSVQLLAKLYPKMTQRELGAMINADPGLVYIGMDGNAARAYGLVPQGFGKPWACLDDPRGWQQAYRAYLWAQIRDNIEFSERVKALRTKTLVCWCKGKRPEHNGDDHCHGDILARAIAYLNGEAT